MKKKHVQKDEETAVHDFVHSTEREKDMKIRGVNLGNWLVLEKWMCTALFDGTTAEDEYELPRQLPREVYEARIRLHRAEYITERDFVIIKSRGFNMVRLPIPFFVFGDVEPYIGCVEEVDKALDWAERYGLQVLLDLHTVPGSQNGFDNGGMCGVCKWAQRPDHVEFALTVLERLAKRYGTRKGLYGIEVLNEPVSEKVWELMDIPHRYPNADKNRTAGSAPIDKTFLRKFYLEAYDRLRVYLPEEKAVVLHDGFDLLCWKDFMQDKEKYRNVVLDTHQYLMMAELMGCGLTVEEYLRFIRETYQGQIEEMEHYFPVICGEWCLFNSMACGVFTKGGQTVVNGVVENSSKEAYTDEEKKEIYRKIADAQLAAWDKGHGYFFWAYKLLLDTVHEDGWIGWDSWDSERCISEGWLNVQ